jgi:hypothetical protein
MLLTYSINSALEIINIIDAETLHEGDDRLQRKAIT